MERERGGSGRNIVKVLKYILVDGKCMFLRARIELHIFWVFVTGWTG